jgi:hypothetical protein
MGEWMYVYLHIFLTSALVGGQWSASRLCRFTRGERDPRTHWIRGWGWGPEPVWTTWRKKFLTLPWLELQLLSCPARSQSLYRLRYPGYYKMWLEETIFVSNVAAGNSGRCRRALDKETPIRSSEVDSLQKCRPLKPRSAWISISAWRWYVLLREVTPSYSDSQYGL